MTKREYLETNLRREMESAGVDAVIGISPENVQHLSGAFIISQRMIPNRLAFACYRREGAPFFVVNSVVEYTARTQSWIDEVVPYTEHDVLPIDGLIKSLKDHGLEKGRIWVEMGFLPAREADLLRAALPNLEILDAEGVLNRSRMIKTPDERQLIIQNARVWEKAVRDGCSSVKEGESERSIAQRLIRNLIDGGAEWVPFSSFAAGSEHTRIGHWVADETPVRRGDILHIGMVGFSRGYYTVLGCMAIMGPPSPAQRDAYHKVISLQDEMIARAKPGIHACDFYRQSIEVGKKLGMDFSMTGIGHSIGIGVHEYPILSPHEEQALVSDMLLCIEIGHAFDGVGRLRVKDLVRVTEQGGERLTTLMDTGEMLVVGAP